MKISNNAARALSLAACVLWIGFIFYNSGKTGIKSNETTMNIVSTIVKPEKIETEGKDEKDNHKVQDNKEADESYFKKINYLFRKSAHAIEFFVLAILIAISLKVYGIKGKAAIINVLFAVLLLAVLDEFYQSFVPGRTSRVQDVLIDFGGGVIGIAIIYLLEKINRVKRKYKIC